MNRIGRPPASTAADTRQRIFDAARRLFAERGFSVTTTRMVAEEAGVTSAALYHYYPSKVDLFVAVQLDSRDLVRKYMTDAVYTGDTFVDRAMGLLDATRVMHQCDPTLERFTASARVDILRRPELLKALGTDSDWWVEILTSIVGHGVSTGEIPEEHRELTYAFMLALLLGITDTAAIDARLHSVAINAVRFALRNSLLTPSGTIRGNLPGPGGS